MDEDKDFIACRENNKFAKEMVLAFPSASPEQAMTLSPETLLCSTGLITVGFRPFLLIPGWEIGPLLFNQTTTTVQVKPVPI